MAQAVKTKATENLLQAVYKNVKMASDSILNLMPKKIETETQLARLLGNTPLQVELEFLQTATHKATHTSEEHMLAFYKTFDELKDRKFDGMVITGRAPGAAMDFGYALVEALKGAGVAAQLRGGMVYKG